MRYGARALMIMTTSVTQTYLLAPPGGWEGWGGPEIGPDREKREVAAGLAGGDVTERLTRGARRGA